MPEIPQTPLNLPMTVGQSETCDIYRCGNVSMWIVRNNPSEQPSFDFNTEFCTWSDVRALFVLLLSPEPQRQIRATVTDGSYDKDTIAEYAAIEAVQNAGEQPTVEELFNFIHAHGFGQVLWHWARSMGMWELMSEITGTRDDAPWRDCERYYELQEHWSAGVRAWRAGDPTEGVMTLAQEQYSVLNRMKPRRKRRPQRQAA